MRSYERGRMLALSAAALAICCSAAHAADHCDEPNLEWVNLFTGPGNNHLQQGEDIAIDPWASRPGAGLLTLLAN